MFAILQLSNSKVLSNFLLIAKPSARPSPTHRPRIIKCRRAMGDRGQKCGVSEGGGSFCTLQSSFAKKKLKKKIEKKCPPPPKKKKNSKSFEKKKPLWGN